MTVPYNQSGAWVANFGPGYTGLGSGGANTVQWSIRTTADVAVAGYDWTAGALELAGGEGQYLITFPTGVVTQPGQYVIRARTGPTGKCLSEELIFVAPGESGLSVIRTPA